MDIDVWRKSGNGTVGNGRQSNSRHKRLELTTDDKGSTHQIFEREGRFEDEIDLHLRQSKLRSQRIGLDDLDLLLIGQQVIPSNPPIGIIYIATAIKDAGYSVKVYDPAAEYLKSTELCIDPLKNLYLYLKTSPPISLIGISLHGEHLIQNDLKIIRTLRTTHPHTVIVVGGSVSTRPQTVFNDKNDCPDIAVIGEGELILKKLLYAVKKYQLNSPLTEEHYKKLKNIPAITAKIGDRIIETKYTRYLKYLPDPNKLNLDFETIDINTYFNNSHTLMLYTNRWCPGNCAFCSIYSIRCAVASKGHFSVKKLKRMMSPTHVVKLIASLSKYLINEIYFCDDTFTYPRWRTSAICENIIKYKKSGKIPRNVMFSCQTRVDAIDKHILEKMASAGFTQISFGIEVNSQRNLNSLEKNVGVDAALEAISLSLKNDIRPKALLILFLPDDKVIDCINTIDFALDIILSGCKVEFNYGIEIFSGTKMETKYGTQINTIFDGRPTIINSDKKVQQIFKQFAAAYKNIIRKYILAPINWDYLNIAGIGILINEIKNAGYSTTKLEGKYKLIIKNMDDFWCAEVLC